MINAIINQMKLQHSTIHKSYIRQSFITKAKLVFQIIVRSCVLSGSRYCSPAANTCNHYSYSTENKCLEPNYSRTCCKDHLSRAQTCK